MAIKRLHPGFGIGEDSCISGNHPMREDDVLNGTEGLYLGNNPESPSKGLFITFWEADEIAQKIGFPHIVVYEAQLKQLQDQEQRIAELEDQLQHEIHNLQLKAVSTEIKNVKKELLSEVEGLTAAIRARLGSGGSAAGSPKGAARTAGAASAK